MRKTSLFILFVLSLSVSVAAEVEKVSIEFDRNLPQVAFAVDELNTALAQTCAL